MRAFPALSARADAFLNPLASFMEAERGLLLEMLAWVASSRRVAVSLASDNASSMIASRSVSG